MEDVVVDEEEMQIKELSVRRPQVIQILINPVSVSYTCLQSSSNKSRTTLGITENKFSLRACPPVRQQNSSSISELEMGVFPTSPTYWVDQKWSLLWPTAKNTTLALFPRRLTALVNIWTMIFEKNKFDPLWRLMGEGNGWKFFLELVFLGKHSARTCSCSLSNINSKQHFSWQKKSEKTIRLEA